MKRWIEVEEEKPKLKSKTIQYNGLWLAIATALLIAFAENQVLVKEYLPDWAYLVVIMFNSGVGIYLRTVSTAPVKPFKKQIK